MNKRAEFVAAVAVPLLAWLVYAGPAAGAAAVSSCATEVVKSKAGPVCGTLAATSTGQQARAFLGIPYAESTAGAKRWTAPVRKRAWTETFAAVRYGSICPQTVPKPATKRRGILHTAKSHATAAPQPPSEHEDCLSLNIWTPAGAKAGAGLPVLVFIYGGAFVAGASADPLYDGAYLAANSNVVLVSFNYRLGVLGFLAADGLSGNYGFMDQQAALSWVRDNIRAFGGDPGKVTLAGESAGAMSVGLHLYSAPGSVALFRAGIMQSNFLALPYKPLAAQINVGNIFKQGLNCRDLACLRKVPVGELIAAQDAFTAEMSTVFSGAQYYIPFGPTLDGKVLIRQPAAGAADDAARKPILIGTNRNEAVLFVEGHSISSADYAAETASIFGKSFERVIARYPGQKGRNDSLQWARVQTEYFLTCSSRRLAANAKAPVFAYLFNHQPSFPVWGRGPCRQDGNVCHGDELPFVFHSADKINGRFTADERKLSDSVMRYWTNFATHLNPNGESEPKATVTWPRFRARTMSYLSFNTTGPSVARDPDRQACAFWDRIEPPVCFIRIDRGNADNGINRILVAEFAQALTACEEPSIHVVVVEGRPDVFCLGADFQDYADDMERNVPDPEALYDVWQRLGSGPFVSIAHVRGKTNAGGVGFAAACDVVLADSSAQFSLSEMLFSLFPACVLPFLIKRVGIQKAHVMTLTTMPVTARQALDWGLVDDLADPSEPLLRKYLLRLSRLSKTGIRNYKAYMSELNTIVTQSKPAAIAANRELFADPQNKDAIRRFVRTGLFPWETENSSS